MGVLIVQIRKEMKTTESHITEDFRAFKANTKVQFLSIVLVVDRRSIVKGTKIASGSSPIYKEVDRRSMPSKNVVV